jgi:hypothetical protein
MACSGRRSTATRSVCVNSAPLMPGVGLLALMNLLKFKEPRHNGDTSKKEGWQSSWCKYLK